MLTGIVKQCLLDALFCLKTTNIMFYTDFEELQATVATHFLHFLFVQEVQRVSVTGKEVLDSDVTHFIC